MNISFRFFSLPAIPLCTGIKIPEFRSNHFQVDKLLDMKKSQICYLIIL